MVMRTTLRVVLLLPLLVCTWGCRGGDGDQPTSMEEAGLPVDVQAGSADTLPSPMEPDEPSFDSLAGAQEEAAPQTEPADSLPSAVTELSERVRRLEEENDSLRIAVRTLIPLLSTGNVTPSTTQGPPSQEDLLPVDREQVRHWGFRTLLAIFLLLLTSLVVRALAWILEKLAERSPKRRLVFKRLIPVLRILIWGFAAFFIVRVVFSVGGQELLAAAAAIGVAVGFAAQDILKNVFGGLIVLFDQPFQVGDKISVGGTYGEVVAIGLRSTRIVTPDDNVVTVPNSQVVDGQVANANAGEMNCQVVTDLYLPGWVDERTAKKLAFDAAASSKYVFLNKPIVVLVKDKFEETFLTHLKVKAYVLDPRYEFLFMSDVTERARAGFRKAGLIGPDHGARAYVNLDRLPEAHEDDPPRREEEQG